MLIVLVERLEQEKAISYSSRRTSWNRCFYEAVDQNPVLDLYYQDPRNTHFYYRFTFLNKRFQSIKEAYRADNNILDRSIFEDELFLTLNYQNGNVTKMELEIYKELLANMLEELEGMPKKSQIYWFTSMYLLKPC